MSTLRVETAGADALDRAARLLAGVEGGLQRAVRSAMSRSVAHLRASSAQAIRQRYAISQADIRANENVKVRYTYQSGVQAVVTFSGRRIPLYRYDGAAPKSPTQDTGEWVRAQFGGAWHTVHPGLAASGHQLRGTAPTRFQNAFVARMRSGHTGIFERTGGVTSGGGEQLRELMGSSVPQMLGSPEVEDALAREAMEKLEERLDHETMAILNGWR